MYDSSIAKQFVRNTTDGTRRFKKLLSNPDPVTRGAIMALPKMTTREIGQKLNRTAKKTRDILTMPIYASPKQAEAKLGIEKAKAGSVFFELPNSFTKEGANPTTMALGIRASHNNPKGKAINAGIVAHGPHSNYGLVDATGPEGSKNVSAGRAKGGENSLNLSATYANGEAGSAKVSGIIAPENRSNGSMAATPLKLARHRAGSDVFFGIASDILSSEPPALAKEV